MSVSLSSSTRRILVVGLLVGPLTAAAAAQGDPWFVRWETVGIADGLPSAKVLAVAVDEAGVWAGTEKGLVRIAGGETTVYGVEEGLPFPAVTALAVSEATGDLWIGTMGGLARWSGGRIDAFTQLDSGLANDVVYGVAVQGGSVWVATAAGLNRYDVATDTWEIYDVENTLMHEPWCYAVTTAGEDVYVAVWGGGIVVRDGRTGTFREHRDPDGEPEIDLFRDDGLVHDVTSAVAVADGILWAGTYFGLSRYDGRHWRTYTQQDSGLAGDFINFLRADGDVLWVATDQGLGRFDGSSWYAWRREGSRIELETTREDGRRSVRELRSGPASNTIYAIDIRDRDVWLGTAAGLSHGLARFPTPTAPARSR